MPVTLETISDRTNEFAETLKLLARTKVYAGVPSDRAGREGDEESNHEINNAALMYIHEHGAPEVNIPARPVLEPAMKSIKSQVTKMLGQAAGFAFEGDRSSMMKQFLAIGLLAQNAMRTRISNGPFIPLKESTLAARRAQGRSGTKPLIDTGQLRRALTYVIREDGKK